MHDKIIKSIKEKIVYSIEPLAKVGGNFNCDGGKRDKIRTKQSFDECKALRSRLIRQNQLTSLPYRALCEHPRKQNPSTAYASTPKTE